METEIPEFDDNGNLPIGIYDASIESVIHRFGGSKSLRRSNLSQNLCTFFKFIKYYAVEIYIDGSFTTSKLSPGDVDLLVVLPADFRIKNLPAYMRLTEFTSAYGSNKLHIFAFVQGIDDGKIAEILDLFRKDRNLKEKGIIRLEIKK